MAPDQRNPFDPELDGAALRLTFDSRSMRSLSGDEQQRGGVPPLARSHGEDRWAGGLG